MKKTSLKMQILKGTAILAAAGLITRVLGLYNRVFLANVIGAEAMGVYQLIFPVFMVCNAICCSGLETALSRQVAAYSGSNCQGNVQRLVKIAVSASLMMAVVLAAGVYMFARPISVWFLKEPLCEPCLKVLAPVIVFSTAHSCVLGYFYGLKKTAVPASSQLLEQICRVGGIYILSASIFEGNSQGAVLAVWGMVAGDGASCIYTMISYKIHVHRLRRMEVAQGKRSPKAAPRRVLFRGLMQDALPLTVNRLSLTMLQSLEAILIPAMLKLYYTASGQALEIYGVVTGMAMPFIMFPTTVTNALSSMLLPTVAEAAGQKNYSLIRRAVSKSIHYCLLIGIMSMAVFYLYGNGIGTAFFKNTMAGQLLAAFSFLCPFMYISSSLASVLNGFGKTKATLLHNVLSVGIRIGFIVVLVPDMGLTGYLWGVMAGSLTLVLMHTISIVRICGISFSVIRSVLLPMVGAAAGAVISMGVYRWLLNMWALPSLIVIGAACGVLVLIYGAVLLVFGCLEREQ